MKKRLTIALVAHDNRKADMVEWVCQKQCQTNTQNIFN